MKLLFIINTPGQAHTWRYVIGKLLERGHAVHILARDYGSTPALLKQFAFQFDTFKPVGSRSTRLLGSLRHFQMCYQLARGFEPSTVIGFGIDAAVTALRLRKPSVVFTDNDHTWFQNFLTRIAGTTIVTPDCFSDNLGRNHVFVRGYKELAYLHPNYFIPDISVLNELNVADGERYVILRFDVRDAVHDIVGNKGFSLPDQVKLVRALEKHARVFISPEAELLPVLEPYRLKIPYDRFHHAIYYSYMFVGDTGTTASEAAVLGTPSVLCNRQARTIGNYADLKRYGLMYVFSGGSGPAIEKAVELVQNPHLKEDFAARRQKMLADKIDVSSFMADFIENYSYRRHLSNARIPGENGALTGTQSRGK